MFIYIKLTYTCIQFNLCCPRSNSLIVKKYYYSIKKKQQKKTAFKCLVCKVTGVIRKKYSSTIFLASILELATPYPVSFVPFSTSTSKSYNAWIEKKSFS